MIDAASAFIGAAQAKEAADAQVVGPDATSINLRVNGVARLVKIEPRTTLAEVLRGPLGLTGTKIACNRGACSACTVLLDGAADLRLHDARRRGRYTKCYDHRGLARAKRCIPCTSLHRPRCAAMRVLHAGHDHELRGVTEAEREAECRRCPCCDQRALLPLRHLSARHRRDARRSKHGG